MTGDGGLVEVQATAERTPLSRAHLDDLLALAAGRHRGAARASRPAAVRYVRLVLATRNAHKVREFGALLAGRRLDPLPDDVAPPPEDGDTFADNALIKARAAAAATGRAAIADDSGIEAAALDGAPACARRASPARDATDEREPRQAARRGAGRHRACATSCVDRPRRRRTATEHALRGHAATGTLAAEPRGDGRLRLRPAVRRRRRGDGRTMAELTDAEKDAIRHRGRAARELARWLSATLIGRRGRPRGRPRRSRSSPTGAG